jgi:hypothetical protein
MLNFPPSVTLRPSVPPSVTLRPSPNIPPPKGNGSDEALSLRGTASSPINTVRQAVCAKWLAPILTGQFPKFSAWMLVGEGFGVTPSDGVTRNVTGADGLGGVTGLQPEQQQQFITIDFPLDGLGAIAIPAGECPSKWLPLCRGVTVTSLCNRPPSHPLTIHPTIYSPPIRPPIHPPHQAASSLPSSRCGSRCLPSTASTSSLTMRPPRR